MKILIVDELFYPLGGIQVRFKGLAEAWVKAGHSVSMTAIDHKGSLPEREVINGVVYNRLLKDPTYYKSGRFGRRISTIFKYSFKLHSYFKQDWDVILFGQFPIVPQIFYKLFYKKKSRTALDLVEYRDSRLWKIINNIIINSVDDTICISEHVKNCSLKYRKNNLHIMPSFVDMSESVSKNKTNYLFLGRMEEHKHPEDAVKAVIAYNERYNKSKELHLVGSGNLLNSLVERYKDFSFIKFLGGVTDEEKGNVLENGRLLVFPSEREGLPVVVIEAMSYDIPTVTTDYPGNGTQFFVKQENIGEIAKPTIEDIVDKINTIEENYEYFANRCNQVKSKYDLTKVSNEYLEIFK